MSHQLAHRPTHLQLVDPALLDGTGPFDPIPMDVFLNAIESVHGFVLRRLTENGRRDAFDNVIQDIRLEAWKTRAKYDPMKGSFGSYVQGIASRVVLRVNDNDARYKRPDHIPLHEIDERIPADTIDPLETLAETFDRRLWLDHLARHVDPNDWVIAASSAINSLTAEQAASRFEITTRAYRTIRERVGLTGETVRRAVQAAHNGEPATLDTARTCIPDAGHLRTVADLIPDHTDNSPALAAATGLSASRLRHLVPRARRLLTVAITVIHDEHHSPLRTARP